MIALPAVHKAGVATHIKAVLSVLRILNLNANRQKHSSVLKIVAVEKKITHVVINIRNVRTIMIIHGAALQRKPAKPEAKAIFLAEIIVAPQIRSARAMVGLQIHAHGEKSVVVQQEKKNV